VADDVSSRSIEGANPLYLPQAKTYDDAVGLSGTIVLRRADGRDPARTAGSSWRSAAAARSSSPGSTSVEEMRRSFEELAEHLFRELSTPRARSCSRARDRPAGRRDAEPGRRVRIEIDGVGILEHAIYRHDREEPR
jgi:2-dehydro-3-deoxy-D-arabinonate dehydratase